jgi:uncharacterized membrane protein YdjX (TVP38/TMEM64 family)
MAEPEAKPAGASALALARRFGPLALVAAGLIAALAFGLPHELSLHALRHHRDQLEAGVRLHPVLSLLAYIGIYTLAVALSLPVPMVMTLTGGFLFGPWIGGLASAISCTLGAGVVFLVCRTAAGDVLRRRAGPTIAKIEDDVLRDAFSYIVVLRLLPVMPMWLVNLALGFIEAPFRTYMIATFIGILPVSVVYAWLGAGLGKLFAHGGRIELSQALSPGVLAALGGLVVLSLVPILVRRMRRGRS